MRRIRGLATEELGLDTVHWRCGDIVLQSSPLTLALILASLAQTAACLWSCRALFGARAAWLFLAVGVVLGWGAEQMGSTHGWFFGSYRYTEVLGPRVGAVPFVIPLMWFSLCHVGFVMAGLVLWRQPVPQAGKRQLLLTALLAAMIVTAFDLGADPYFVYQLKAWIMAETDGGWFGETVRGFEGWMLVSFTITTVFQLLARPQLAQPLGPHTRAAALVPIAIYAGAMAFQMAVVQPVALRVIAFFAMGIPALIAAAAWHQWSRRPEALAL